MIFLLSACIKRDNEGAIPVISLVPGNEVIFSDTTIGAGSKMNFHVQSHGSDYALTNFLINVTSDSVRTIFDTSLYSADLDWTGSFLKGSNENETWQFIIRDRISKQNESSIQIKLGSTSAYKPVELIENIRLGAQQNSSYESFFSINSNESYAWEEAENDAAVQTLIDLCYYYSGEDLNTIASPGANIEEGVFPGHIQDWEVRNTARYLITELTLNNFNQISNDSILIALYNENDAKRKAKNLNVGDCYVFRIEDSRLGAFFIHEVTAEESGDIRIDIKIQEN